MLFIAESDLGEEINVKRYVEGLCVGTSIDGVLDVRETLSSSR